MNLLIYRYLKYGLESKRLDVVLGAPGLFGWRIAGIGNKSELRRAQEGTLSSDIVS
jgi:hypothetical protein